MRNLTQAGFKIIRLATALGAVLMPTVALSQNSPSVANPTTTPAQTSTGTYVGAAQAPAGTIIQNMRSLQNVQQAPTVSTRPVVSPAARPPTR